MSVNIRKRAVNYFRGLEKDKETFSTYVFILVGILLKHTELLRCLSNKGKVSLGAASIDIPQVQELDFDSFRQICSLVCAVKYKSVRGASQDIVGK